MVQNHAGRAQMDAYLVACHEIRSGLHLADSIDRFIDFNRNNPAIQFCGKVALAQTILEPFREVSMPDQHVQARRRSMRRIIARRTNAAALRA